MDIALLLHSFVRFVILLIAVIGIIKTLVALLQKSAAAKLDQTLASVFVGLYDLQALLGILIVFLGGLTQAVHPIVMLIGLVVAHGLQTLTKRAGGQQAHLNRLALYVVPLAIILFGLASIG